MVLCRQVVPADLRREPGIGLRPRQPGRRGNGSRGLGAHANKEKGYDVKYWEIGNETYLPGTYYPATAREYAEAFGKYARAMKGVDPSIQIGAVGPLGSRCGRPARSAFARGTGHQRELKRSPCGRDRERGRQEGQFER